MPLPQWATGRRSAVVIVVVLLAAVVGVLQWRAARLDDRAQIAAERFAAAASTGDLAPARLLGAPQGAQEFAELTKGLDGVSPEVVVTAVARDGDEATADLRWTWPFGPDGWSYTTRLPVAAGDGGWGARWSPQVVHPTLRGGDALVADRTEPERGEVLGRDGAPLVRETAVVEVGVQPSRTQDAPGLSRTLATLLDIDAAALEKRIAAAAPDAFVSVIVLRRSDYDPLRARLQPLAGTVFRESTRPLAPTRSFARALLGAAGPVTAELVEESEGRLAPGDVAGLSGLQREYDERLAGISGVKVERVAGEVREELFSVPPVPGQPIRVSLDEQVQSAADAALGRLDGGGRNASLVAVDVATGDLLAVANTPATGANRAFTGRYPPGSTFKTATTLALLATGLTPADTVECPPTATVDGRAFRNFEGGALGDVPFRTAFAESCNTAFVSLAERLEAPALPAAGRALGLGVPWQVGVDVFAGQVPAPTSPVELAATAIGQGRVLAGPAVMAQVAATIARGSWSPPRLVLEPEPEGERPADPPAPDPARLATVRELMRGVVTAGTAQALADVPGPPVHAKTGTAEYGTQSPPRTHAWVIGFQGGSDDGMAFAVLVENGSSGGEVAVPVAEAFLRGVRG